jgi:uncharacterized membrane protein YcaP (DUF421 family)
MLPNGGMTLVWFDRIVWSDSRAWIGIRYKARMMMTIESDLMQMGVPLVEKILRPIIVYVFLVVALRIAGKRQLAQINTFDLVVLLMLSNTVQNAIIGHDDSLVGGLIGAVALILANMLVMRVLRKHPIIYRLLEGCPVNLIEHGKIQEKVLKQENIALQDLQEAAHRQGFSSLDQVETAILETSGAIVCLEESREGEAKRHAEIINRLDLLSHEVAQLRNR